MYLRLTLATMALVLGGCSQLPPRQPSGSPCDLGEATYACQVERYHNVNAD